MRTPQVSPQEAAKLGKELTCVGAEQAGNAEGTIPPYTGKYLGEVPGWNHVKFSGDQPVDPYAAEKPILVITAQNMSQYESHLTEGQKALLKKYPTTYKMNIYPGHRDFRYPDYVCRRAMDNALHAKLVNDGAGFTGIGPGAVPDPQKRHGSCCGTTNCRPVPTPRKKPPTWRRSCPTAALAGGVPTRVTCRRPTRRPSNPGPKARLGHEQQHDPQTGPRQRHPQHCP